MVAKIAPRPKMRRLARAMIESFDQFTDLIHDEPTPPQLVKTLRHRGRVTGLHLDPALFKPRRPSQQPATLIR
jgi:hypothetical protein